MEHGEIIVALARWVPAGLGLIGLVYGIAGLVGSELREKRRERRTALWDKHASDRERIEKVETEMWENWKKENLAAGEEDRKNG